MYIFGVWFPQFLWGVFRLLAILIRFCTFCSFTSFVATWIWPFEMLLVALIWGFSSVPVEGGFSKRIFASSFSCDKLVYTQNQQDFDSVACNGFSQLGFLFLFLKSFEFCAMFEDGDRGFVTSSLCRFFHWRTRVPLAYDYFLGQLCTMANTIRKDLAWPL